MNEAYVFVTSIAVLLFTLLGCCRVWFGLLAIINTCMWLFCDILSLSLYHLLPSKGDLFSLILYSTLNISCTLLLLVLYARNSSYYIYKVITENIASPTLYEMSLFDRVCAVSFGVTSVILSFFPLLSGGSGGLLRTGCETAWERLVIFPYSVFLSKVVFFVQFRSALAAQKLELFLLSLLLLVLIFIAGLCDEVCGTCTYRPILIFSHSFVSVAVVLYRICGASRVEQ